MIKFKRIGLFCQSLIKYQLNSDSFILNKKLSLYINSSSFQQLLWTSYLSWTLVNVQSPSFRNGFTNFLNLINFNLKWLFPTMKTKYSNSFLDNLIAFRTSHIFRIILIAGNMEIVLAWGDHHWAIGSTDFAFNVFKVSLPPFDVVL